MHVKKSVLVALAVVILGLTASLAYMVGKSADAVDSKSVIETVNKPGGAEPLAAPPISPVETESTVEEPAPPQKAVVPDPVLNKAFSNSEQGLIDAYFKGEDMCRGSSDVETVEVWCPRRDAAYEAMVKAGICYGRENDSSAADYDIHRCRKGSNR